MNPVLLIDQLRKTYPRSWRKPPVEALKGISFEVGKGEVFGFIGPNGAGKSTTIKILTGAMAASGGRILINGKDASNYSARFGLGYVPENPYLNDYLTPLEVLQTGVRIHRVRVDDERAYCLRWLERFGIAEVCNRRIRTFSKGMTQRTVLAHALALKPEFLVLDEPLSGLDPVGRKDVVDILDEYKRAGGTLLFTSHVLHDVERLADRFGLIHKGELLTLQSPTDFVGGEQVYTVRSLGEKAVDGLQSEGVGRWTADVSSDMLWETLERLRKSNHQLLEVKPALTLERVFMRYVGADGASSDSKNQRLNRS